MVSNLYFAQRGFNINITCKLNLYSLILVQLLEFKIQQEKVLQDDLRTSLDVERNRSSDLSGQLNHEKSSNLDLQSKVTSLQTQVAKLREGLEREQSRYVSIT